MVDWWYITPSPKYSAGEPLWKDITQHMYGFAVSLAESPWLTILQTLHLELNKITVPQWFHQIHRDSKHALIHWCCLQDIKFRIGSCQLTEYCVAMEDDSLYCVLKVQSHLQALCYLESDFVVKTCMPIRLHVFQANSIMRPYRKYI
jgi:hypothetical protein